LIETKKNEQEHPDEVNEQRNAQEYSGLGSHEKMRLRAQLQQTEKGQIDGDQIRDGEELFFDRFGHAKL